MFRVSVKLVVFDLDGVLVEAREIHYKALNNALCRVGGPSWMISREDHISTYNGLPTRKKLELLSEKQGVKRELHEKIWQLKQEETYNEIEHHINLTDSFEQVKIMRYLKEHHYDIYCASNAIRKSVVLMLRCSGCLKYIDIILSNEDVQRPKPHPEMYLQCILHSGVSPQETLIVEDSPIGEQAALSSGAYVLKIYGTNDLTLDLVKSGIKYANECDDSNGWRRVKIPAGGLFVS